MKGIIEKALTYRPVVTSRWLDGRLVGWLVG